MSDIILYALWAILATACIFNWTAQLRWHRHYIEELERIRTGAVINYNIANLQGKVRDPKEAKEN